MIFSSDALREDELPFAAEHARKHGRLRGREMQRALDAKHGRADLDPEPLRAFALESLDAEGLIGGDWTHAIALLDHLGQRFAAQRELVELGKVLDVEVHL